MSISLESFDESKKNTIKMKDIVAKSYLQVTKINPWHLDKKIVNDPDLIKDPVKCEIIKDLLQIRKEGHEDLTAYSRLFSTQKQKQSTKKTQSKAKRQALRKKHTRNTQKSFADRNSSNKKTAAQLETERDFQKRLNSLKTPSSTEFSPGYIALEHDHKNKMNALRAQNDRNERLTALGVEGNYPFQKKGTPRKPAFPEQHKGESNAMYSLRIEHEKIMELKNTEKSLNTRLNQLNK